MSWTPSTKADAYKKDYFVPNFGADKDMVATKKHYEEAERKYGYFWDVLKPKPKPHPVDYFVPHFGEDPDITASKKNLKDAEGVLGSQSLPPKDYLPTFV